MIDVIRQNLSKSIVYYILTGDADTFRGLLNKYNIPLESITLKSVKPEELSYYYKKCHYGFILRDDMVVNAVACPTKLVEYLYYGIIPIVKSPRIGDFSSRGYEYIDYTAFSSKLSAVKSSINIEIVSSLILENQAVALKDLYKP
jgi:hypothetical protein